MSTSVATRISTAVKTDRPGETSPLRLARVTGAFFLLTTLAGIFAQGFVSEKLVVSGDAAATAANILAHPLLFQAGFAIYLIEMVCQVVMTVLFYELLKPAGRRVALVMACLSLTGCVIKAFSRLFYIAPLLVLGGAPYLSVFDARQLPALALILLKLNAQGAGMALVFFGFSTLLQGYLLLRSTFLPRVLGVLAVLGGLGWLTYLYPPLGDRLFLVIVAVGLVGAVAIILRLLVSGVNVQRWQEQAGVLDVSIRK